MTPDQRRALEAWEAVRKDQDTRHRADVERAAALRTLTLGETPPTTVAAVARALGVTRETIYRWRDDY